MFCPKCGYPQKCACMSCQHKDGQIIIDGELAKCFNCGFTRHLDWWASLEWDVYSEEVKKNIEEQKAKINAKYNQTL